MTLPASGAIAMAQVNAELFRSAGSAVNLNESAVRNLFGKPSGAIALSDGYGKSSAISYGTNYQTVERSGFTAKAGVMITGTQVYETHTGTVIQTFTAINHSWLYCKATLVSGSTPSGGTLNTILPTSSAREIWRDGALTGVAYVSTIRLDFYQDAAGSVLAASGTFVLSAKKI